MLASETATTDHHGTVGALLSRVLGVEHDGAHVSVSEGSPSSGRLHPDKKRPGYAAMSDPALVSAIVRGDRSALLEACDRHARSVYVIACEMCGEEQALMLTESLFIGLWLEPPRGSPGMQSLRTVLHQRAHRATSEMRRVAGDPPPHVSEDRVRIPSDLDRTIDQRAFDQFAGARATDLLAKLSPAEREVAVMAYFGGCTCVDLAALFNTSEAAIAMLLRSGLGRLRARAAAEQLATHGSVERDDGANDAATP